MSTEWLTMPEWLFWTVVVVSCFIAMYMVRRHLSLIVGVVLSFGLLVLSNEGVIPTLPGM